ncbi:MAG: GPW/gp25 family protein [Alphaproteobacteria bacterium]
MASMTPQMDFPFGIDARGLTATTDDDDHIRDMIRLVLFTTPGERVNRPDFGCGLKQLVFAPASETIAAVTEQLVHGSLIRWLDPVIAVEKVEVRAEDATLEITVVYARRDTGERAAATFEQPIPA